MFYAVVQAGGKQYRVSPGQTLAVEKLPAQPGDRVELDQVLMIVDEERVTLGTPMVEGAHVVAEVLRQAKDEKITVFKYKRKTRYRRKRGHRQLFTELAVRQIVTG